MLILNAGYAFEEVLTGALSTYIADVKAHVKGCYDMSTATVLRDLLLLFLELVLSLCDVALRLFVPRPMKSVHGEVALVTGAGSGIGRQFALQLSRLGAKVACWDVNEASCAATAEEVRAAGGTAWAFRCDVADRAEVARVAQKTRDAVGAVTILVNNAGIMPAKPFLRHTQEDVETIFRVNVFSQFWTLLEFLPDFLSANHGHVVSMSSMAGITGTAYITGYCASKFAVKGLMDALFFELRKEDSSSSCRVKLTTAHPFTVNTGLAHRPTSRFPSLLPFTEPDECARVVVEAMLREEEEVFVPRSLQLPMRLGKVMPRRFQLAVNDLLACGVGHKH